MAELTLAGGCADAAAVAVGEGAASTTAVAAGVLTNFGRAELPLSDGLDSTFDAIF